MKQYDVFYLEAEGIKVGIDLGLGQIASFSTHQAVRTLTPFHRVPWAESQDNTLFEGSDPHLRRMSIDFFAAPFTASDVDPAPYHGWPANSPWYVIDTVRFDGGVTARLQLDRSVLGATLVKELTTRDNHPFLYQNHVFRGGIGELPVGYHAMVSLPGGSFLSFSPKIEAMTPAIPLESASEKGRSYLRYPAVSQDIAAFPTADGGFVDLTRYPIAQRHDDLVMLIENPENQLGWSVAARPHERDLALVLKSPRILPFTILWYSNGGRDYAPWNGRHTNVLGIEEVCSFANVGHKASVSPNTLNTRGYPTAVALGEELSIRSVIGAVDWIAGAESIQDIRPGNQSLIIQTAEGQAEVPFDATFLS